jgi:hypothetical protein
VAHAVWQTAAPYAVVNGQTLDGVLFSADALILARYRSAFGYSLPHLPRGFERWDPMNDLALLAVKKVGPLASVKWAAAGSRRRFLGRPAGIFSRVTRSVHPSAVVYEVHGNLLDLVHGETVGVRGDSGLPLYARDQRGHPAVIGMVMQSVESVISLLGDNRQRIGREMAEADPWEDTRDISHYVTPDRSLLLKALAGIGFISEPSPPRTMKIPA